MSEDRRATAVMAALQTVTLFRTLPDSELEALTGQVVRKRFGPNALIFSQGEIGDGMYIVIEGHVSIVRQGPDGHDLVLALAEPGEYFGELALFDGVPRSASAVTLDHCRVLFLSRAAFHEFIRIYPAAVWTCLAVVIGYVRRLTDVADDIALLDLRSRLARRLIRLADQGLIGADGNQEMRGKRAVRITQQHLANMTGSTRESVNKHLKTFEKERLIALEHGQVRVVDRIGLEKCLE